MRIHRHFETVCWSRSQLQRREVAADQSVRLAPLEVFDALDRIAQFRENAVLYLSSLQGSRVRNTMKRHHRVLGHEQPWIFCFQCQLNLLTKQKSRISHAISHLNKVLYCQVGNRIGIDLACVLELAENSFPVRAMRADQLQHASAIFKAAVDALPEERNNRVRRIT